MAKKYLNNYQMKYSEMDVAFVLFRFIRKWAILFSNSLRYKIY